MSEIRWCDAGRHPFPLGKDVDDREYAETKERNGTRVRLDICGQCSRKSSDALTAQALVSSDAAQGATLTDDSTSEALAASKARHPSSGRYGKE